MGYKEVTVIGFPSSNPIILEISKNFGNNMIMHDSIEDLKAMVKDIEKNDGKIPLLLFFCKEE